MKNKKEMEKCDDKNCPFHGSLKTRGRVFTGTVTKLSSKGTVKIEWTRNYYLPKYERYEKRKSALHVHKPGCMEVSIGDKVRVIGSKPISKTKHNVIVEVLK